MRERQTCQGCGTRADEWDPAQGGHLDAYTAEGELCHGCRALEIKRKEYEDAPAGVLVVMQPRGSHGG